METQQTRRVDEIQVQGPMPLEYAEILTPTALSFITQLVSEFTHPLRELLRRRRGRQQQFDAGKLPDFLPHTRAIREASWRIREIPEELQDRRVEITGPADRKMIINALNSGATVFMADFEDSLSPTWDNVMRGQVNLRDAADRTIEYVDPVSGKTYRLDEDIAVLMCRPRGLHLHEDQVTVKEVPIPAALFDFGLYLFHNHGALRARGSGPYFYLAKLESHLEARWWARVFERAEEMLVMPHGTIKATVLIETLPAAFEMDEFLYELRDYIVGLNCGRWDYIFSYMKTLQNHPDRVLPDRDCLSMGRPFLDAYSRLLVRTCHRRGALAIGGMSAYVPVKGNFEANAEALCWVDLEKQAEAANGHDGTWVAHPGLCDLANKVYSEVLGERKNQLHVTRDHDPPVTAAELLAVPEGDFTVGGMRRNVVVSLQYIAAWLCGRGCVQIANKMEDAATAEIARTQVWQWIRQRQPLADGVEATIGLFHRLLRDEVTRLLAEHGEAGFAQARFGDAAVLLVALTQRDNVASFFTTIAYKLLLPSRREVEARAS